MEFLIAIAVGGFVALIFAIASDEKRSRSSLPDTEHTEASTASDMSKIIIRTRSTSHKIPSNPRFFNIGKNVFHKSRDCWAFSELDEWEACTEDEAISRGLKQCPFCEKPLAFVYGHSRVYHTTTWCSDSGSEPLQLFEEEAMARGFRKCKVCQKRDGDLPEKS